MTLPNEFRPLGNMKRSQESCDFEGYWRSIRPNDVELPLKSSVNPARLKSLIGWLAFARVEEDRFATTVTMIGQSIRDLIGFNLTGMNFNDLDNLPDKEAARKRHLGYHDHPFGRVEELDIRFSNDISAVCELTLFPVWGENQERILFCLLQPKNTDPRLVLDNRGFLTQGSIDAAYIDLGNGVPAE